MASGYDKQYAAQNAGALQRPAAIMGAPGLVWHRAFWKPDSLSETAWRDSIDYFLFLVFMHTRAEAERCDTLSDFTTTNFDVIGSRFFGFRNTFVANTKFENWRTERQVFEAAPAQERSVRHNIFSVRAAIDGLMFTVRASSHSEYWTLSVLCDLAESTKEGLAKAGSNASAIINLYNEIKTHAEFRFRERWTASSGGPAKAEPEYLSRVRITLVDVFRTLVLEKILCQWEALRDHDQFEFREIGGTFAEFFGTIIGIEIQERREDSPDAPAMWCFPMGDALIKRTTPDVIASLPIKSKTARHIVDAFWPVIDNLHKAATGEALYGKPEYTVSLFQSARTLYISSLGRLTPSAQTLWKDEPVIYTLVSTSRARAPLGRLVDRLNTLGTLRLAALRDLQRLSDTSDKMRDLERSLNKSDPSIAPAQYASALKALGVGFPEGLMHRVDRSRYYVGQWIELVRQLRSSSIWGYQSYDDFVKRKLFDTFDFIDRIGKRYTELRSEVQLLLDAERTEKTVSLQTNIRNFLGAIDRQHAVTNTLLEYAEWFVGAPIAYYSGMGVHYVSQLTRWPVSEGEGIIAGICIYFAAIISVHRIRDRQKTKKETAD
jgi:hypothetical protein